jgi:hypothetical protein
VATNQHYTLSNDVWFISGEFTLTAAGAVVPNSDGTTTTDPLITAARIGAGTYLVTIPGNFQRTLFASAEMRPSGGSPTSQVAEITAISLGGGAVTASGESTTTVTLVTGNSNATPAAADQANGIVGFDLRFQKHKI